jgi:[protein-PII] uridylyltransferase
MEQIFNTAALEQALAGENPPLDVFRNALDQGTQSINSGFGKAVPVTTLISQRTKLVDTLLTAAWNLHIPDKSIAALIAVGGYGRGELHPYSDIDLMILLAIDETDFLKEGIERFLTSLWDIGLEVGHSVRTIKDCVQEASQDITVMTNIMESRLLSGPWELFQEMRNATGPKRIWASEEFFREKWKEQQNRYEKYDDTAHNLEPNLKEGPGGLRDIQTLGWVAKRHFGCETMHGLVRHNFLTEAEYDALMEGRSLLWRIRFALHILTGRREDRLLFDYQRTLAEQFGFVDQDHSLAVEQFMQQYYRTAMRLERLNERLLQLFQEAILHRDQEEEILPINNRFQACNGFIEVTDKNLFRRYPYALLEIFLLLQLNPDLKGVRASTVRLIRANRFRINDEFRADVRARSLFMEIMRQPKGITHELRRMNRYGILAAYLPVFANIVGRMQYDLFHAYTVDAHTLFVVRNLRRFAVPKYAGEFPLCSDIMSRLPKPELLYLAGLFHDIAKGRGGDHSQLGAEDARAFCRQHQLSEYDTELVGWLVEKHLIMSMTAQRQDISDPEVVYQFAQEMQNLTRLDYLYLLTVADIRATDPKKWNSWKDALLRELYVATQRALLRGLSYQQDADDLIQEKQRKAYRLLEERGITHKQAHDLWLDLSIDYFLHSSPEEIAWHSETILATDRSELPAIRILRKSDRGASEIFLYCENQPGLFALTTALLDRLRLNIVDARIETSDNNTTLDSYSVLEENGKPIRSKAREKEIIEKLQQGLRNPDSIDLKVQRRVSRQLKHFSVPTRIDFYQDESNRRTIMQLVTSDRPGLLAEVGLAFARCGITLHNAKISTVGAEVADTFFITDHDGSPLYDPARLRCLERGIYEQLDSGEPERSKP